MRQTFRHRPATLAALVGGVALFVAACGGGTATASAPAQATQAASSAASGGITVTESDFKIVVSAASAAPGPITFQVTNSSTQVHEFVVVKTEMMGDALPTSSDGTEVDEEASGLTVVDEIEDIAAGASHDLDVTLEAGHYVLLCNVPGHYALGMHTNFTVGP